MDAPLRHATGMFFDGETARQHRVRLDLIRRDDMWIRLTGDTLEAELEWPVAHLRALQDQSDRSRLVLSYRRDTDDESPRDPARLIITDPDWVGWLHKTRPDLHKADLHKGALKRLGIRLGLACVAVFVMLFVILPRMADTLATLIPIEREIAFGKSVTGQMERVLGGTSLGALHCTNEAGIVALDQMLARLSEGQDLQYDIDLIVFDHPMLNAFAAPGGQIVLMRGLLEQAESADAVAAVLAHEIGHVESRDATRHALRAAGSAGLLSMVLGDFTGGAGVVLISEHLFQAAYTREAEAGADVFALEMLNNADVSSAGMASFFEMLDDGEGLDLPEYFSTHPASAGRADRAEENAVDQAETVPVLSDDEWADLVGICG
jgi:Zn-dependent protease with chaperone function